MRRSRITMIALASSAHRVMEQDVHRTGRLPPCRVGAHWLACGVPARSCAYPNGVVRSNPKRRFSSASTRCLALPTFSVFAAMPLASSSSAGMTTCRRHNVRHMTAWVLPAPPSQVHGFDEALRQLEAWGICARDRKYFLARYKRDLSRFAGRLRCGASGARQRQRSTRP